MARIPHQGRQNNTISAEKGTVKPRVVVACEACHRRKIRCETLSAKSNQCQHCKKLGKPCIGRQLDRSSERPSPATTKPSSGAKTSPKKVTPESPSPPMSVKGKMSGKRKFLELEDPTPEAVSAPNKKAKMTPKRLSKAARCPSPCNDIRMMFASQPRLHQLRGTAGCSVSSRSSSTSGRPSSAKERVTTRLSLNEPCTTPWEAESTSDHYSSQSSQLNTLLSALNKKRKIIVVAGAGISVAAGIPDFRSTNGLFNRLKSSHSLKSSGRDLFDASVYKHDASTASFHDMVRNLAIDCRQAEPTQFHHLLNKLAKDGRLLRLYTQNVDGLDIGLDGLQTVTPLPKKAPFPKTVQLHGGLSKMVCQKCQVISDLRPELFDGTEAPTCPTCFDADLARHTAGIRSHGVGRLRPRMLLYNEFNPEEEAIGSCVTADLRTRPDAVIVVGTTLKVPGVRRFVKQMVKVVNDRRDGVAIWINHEPEPKGADIDGITWDLVVQGNCEIIPQLMQRPVDEEEDDIGSFMEIQSQDLADLKSSQGELQVEIEARQRSQSPEPSIPEPQPEVVRSPIADSPAMEASPLSPINGNARTKRFGNAALKNNNKMSKPLVKRPVGRPRKTPAPAPRIEDHLRPVKADIPTFMKLPARSGKLPKYKPDVD